MPTVLIVGASRGIGFELARQYRADDWRVLASARSQADIDRLGALGAEAFELDVANAVSCSGLQWRLDGVQLDVAVINAGVSGPRTVALEPPSQDDFDAVMHTNVLGPMRIVPQLTSAMAAGSRLAMMSSRMGSITERNSTSWWLYRASKAALNSVLRDASVLLDGSVVCVALHPGWVRTAMGGPNATLAVEDSAAGLRRTLAALGPADNGTFRNYDGALIPW